MVVEGVSMDGSEGKLEDMDMNVYRLRNHHALLQQRISRKVKEPLESLCRDFSEVLVTNHTLYHGRRTAPPDASSLTHAITLIIKTLRSDMLLLRCEICEHTASNKTVAKTIAQL